MSVRENRLRAAQKKNNEERFNRQTEKTSLVDEDLKEHERLLEKEKESESRVMEGEKEEKNPTSEGKKEEDKKEVPEIKEVKEDKESAKTVRQSASYEKPEKKNDRKNLIDPKSLVAIYRSSEKKTIRLKIFEEMLGLSQSEVKQVLLEGGLRETEFPKKRGKKSGYDEELVMIGVNIPKSMHEKMTEKIKNNHMGITEYVRGLIEKDLNSL